jgi:Predicted acyl-CoA transferases/carnitine dehydratase
MKTEDGKEIVRKLAARSDVVLESFRPGVAGRLGVDYDSLKKAQSPPGLCLDQRFRTGRALPEYSRT